MAVPTIPNATASSIPGALNNIKKLFSKSTLQQKIMLGVAVVTVVGTIWGLVYFSNRIDYQVLYSDLNPEEAQSIVQKLQEAKVQYEISDDGRTVRIQADKAAEMRLKLASEGLPSSGRIGFEIFDQMNLGLTNFQEQVNYQRALEGELGRSIMTLSEVEAARVHLVLPKDSLFQSAEDQTKASVILKLKTGRTISDGAVQGIINMMASSVKGLTPERVTLIDFRGKILSKPEGEGSLTGQQLDVRQKLESELGTKIVQILEPAVGQGKVRPQVSVLMSFEQVEETTERYDPQASVIRSQQKQEEHQPGVKTVGGIPGPKSQQTQTAAPITPPASTAAAAAGQIPAVQTPAIVSNTTDQGNLTKQVDVTNYEVSKAVRHTIEPVGKVTRVSVAVVIDNHTKTTTGKDGKPQISSEPRSVAEMKQYRDIVSAAVGFNADRGDKLDVENISFEEEPDFAKDPTFIEKQGPVIVTALRYLIIPVAFILIYLLFLRPIQKSIFPAPVLALAPAALPQVKALPQANQAKLQTPMTLKQFEAQLSDGGNAGDEHAGTPEREIMPLPSPSKMEMIRNRVVEHAQRDPETVARLVRIWLSDEKTRS